MFGKSRDSILHDWNWSIQLKVTPPRELEGFPPGYTSSAYAVVWRSLECDCEGGRHDYLLLLVTLKAH